MFTYVYYVYNIAMVHRHAKVLFIYPLTNLFSKKPQKTDIAQMLDH